jgi:CBS domain-containing protein
VTLAAETRLRSLPALLQTADDHRRQRLYGVLDSAQRLVGVITRSDLECVQHQPGRVDAQVDDVMNHSPVVAYADDTLRAAAERMAEARVGAMPVVERQHAERLVGMLSLRDIVLRGRSRVLDEERTRERVLRMRILPPRRATVVEHVNTSAPDVTERNTAGSL